MEYASLGVGNAGLATGIIGTTLGVLNGGLGLFNNGAGVRSCEHYATKDELRYVQEIAQKDASIALLQSEQNTEVKIADVYERLITRINADQRAQADWNASQSVANAQMSAAIANNTNSIAALTSLTKLVIPNTSICPGWGEVTVTPVEPTA